jgi:pentose-5-phosphate-3-epimerase
MNLVSDDVNSAFVRGIEVDDGAFVHTIVFGLEFIDQIDNRRGFPGTGRSVKQ